MKFITFLNKRFDVYVHNDSDPEAKLCDIQGDKVEQLWIFEKDNDCEPICILKDAQRYEGTNGKGYWLIGNIYSNLVHGTEYSENQIKEIIKENKLF